MYLDIQVVDVNTCEALKDTAVEIWAANATGVYSGVLSGMNGNPSDTTNLQRQALRGIQITKHDGSVSFKTIVPGHYTGRAIHIHRKFMPA
jgi:protocatechuate 3,4-dioxygenase beta subunit